MGDRIAVTGANGFVGRHVVLAARARGWDVAGIVRSETGARVVREAGAEPAVLPRWDKEPLARALGGARAVVHLAQIGAERDGATYEEVNVGGMRSLLEAARGAGVRRIVYFSGLGVARYGMSGRCTKAYFLSKLTCEVELHRSGLEAVAFRPSYLVGPGDALTLALLREMASGEVEQPGDGSYRLQPVDVADAADLVLASLDRPATPAVFDLVGPEPLTYQQLLDRLAGVARGLGKPVEFRIRELAIEEVDRRAAAGGYRGMQPDEVDCLLCDEVSDPRPLEVLLGRPLTSLDVALARAVRAA